MEKINVGDVYKRKTMGYTVVVLDTHSGIIQFKYEDNRTHFYVFISPEAQFRKDFRKQTKLDKVLL